MRAISTSPHLQGSLHCSFLSDNCFLYDSQGGLRTFILVTTVLLSTDKPIWALTDPAPL